MPDKQFPMPQAITQEYLEGMRFSANSYGSSFTGNEVKPLLDYIAGLENELGIVRDQLGFYSRLLENKEHEVRRLRETEIAECSWRRTSGGESDRRCERPELVAHLEASTMDRSESHELLAQWFAGDELRSSVSEEDEASAASLLRFLNHTHGVYLHRAMPPGYYVAGHPMNDDIYKEGLGMLHE